MRKENPSTNYITQQCQGPDRTIGTLVALLHYDAPIPSNPDSAIGDVFNPVSTVCKDKRQYLVDGCSQGYSKSNTDSLSPSRFIEHCKKDFLMAICKGFLRGSSLVIVQSIDISTSI